MLLSSAATWPATLLGCRSFRRGLVVVGGGFLTRLPRSTTATAKSLFSTSAPRRNGCSGGRSGRNCFSISLSPTTASKQQVLDAVAEGFASPTRTRRLGDFDAVILASKGLASWLQDAPFVSQLLTSFGHAQNQGQGPEQGSSTISVLSAAVDSIPRLGNSGSSTPAFSPSEGLAVLHGGLDEVLPGLWKERDVESKASQHPALSFRVGPLVGDSDARSLAVTVPLANTVFNNGRPQTVLASRWRVNSGSLPELTEVIEATGKVVVVPTARAHAPDSLSDVIAPLVPLTKPRKLLAGLGNILRQVEIDGRPAPASKELEEVIPKLLSVRAKRGQSQGQTVGPMGVWAVLYPEHLAAAPGLLPQPLELVDADKSAEWAQALDVSKRMPELLASGCHVRRILSGGGGWGLKQGLLSLDPQTKHSTSDGDDVESFIRSLKGEESAGGGGGIITPGVYVQFLVESDGPPASTVSDEAALGPHFGQNRSVAVLGTTRDAVLEDAGASEVKVQEGLFGAFSLEGVYIASEESKEADQGESILSKMDASGSYIVSRL